MRQSYTARRERMHGNRRAFWWALAIPVVVMAQYLLTSTFHVTKPSLIPTLVVGGILYLPVRWVVSHTLVRWQSAHVRLLTALWAAYGLFTLVRLVAFQGHALWSAGDAVDVLAALATVRFPFAHVAPAVLLGPLLYAFARDAYALWGTSPRDALAKGYLAAAGLLVLPLVAYVMGAWWGAQESLPHLWKWGSFRAMVGALALAVVLSATSALAAMGLETWRWRRLEARILKEGWA